MNEEAVKDAYQLFVSNGYNKSIEEFRTLMNTNENARKDMYELFVSNGYNKAPEEFNVLIGVQEAPSVVETQVDVQEEVPVKKKEDTVSPSEDGSSGFAEIFKGPRDFLKTITEKEVQEAPKGIPQQFLPSDGESQMPPSVTDVIIEKGTEGQEFVAKTEEYETYNPAVASKSATADLTQYKDYLPTGVKEIPNAKQVLEGEYNAVVPFDQAAYEKNPEAYQIIYNNKVKDYEEYLKGKAEYIKGYDGKYYSSDKFSPETILRKELATLQSRDGNLMDLGEEVIADRMSERLGKFGFDVKYDPSVIDITSGRIGSAITITSQHTGKKIDINTDKINFIDLMRGDADREDAQEIDKLNAFVLKNFDEDKVEVKDLLKGLSAQAKAAMGAETERKYETLSVGRTISDAEDMVSGIDKQIEAANKMLKEAQAMPDYEEAVSTSVGSGMMMGTSLRGINKKKALKLKQAKAQLEYLKQQKKDADALLKSAEEGKQVQATKFASKVLGEQMMTESERLENEAKKLSYTSKVIGDVDSRIKAAAEKAKTATTQEEINDIAAQSEDDVNTYNELARIATEQQNNYRLDAENLRKDVGRKVILDAQVGGLTGSVVRSLASGVGGVLEGGVETFFGDLYANINNMFYDKGEDGYLTDAERKKIKEDSIQDDIVGYVSDKFGITDESMEAYRKGLSLQDMIKNVKEGKEALEGSNWFTEGIYGMIESLPAIATSLITPQASIASFAALGINGLNKEMESNPMFANVSENEKLLLTLPYGVVIGVLENYGFRNALNNSSLVSKIMFKALKKSKRTTNRNFRELVVDEVENKLAKGGFLLAASTLSEMETGAAQQAVEGYMKEAYDVAKGMDYFKQSIDFLDGKYITKEFIDEVWKAGLSEAVGGFAMGAMPAISQARKNNTIAEIPIGAFMAYEMAMLDPAIRRAQTMRITEQVELGLKTKEEAAKEVQDYDITIGQLRAIPQEFDLKSRQQILALESQKKILEDKIEGKSVFTTREQQRQIKVLEERIEEVSANAQKGEAKKSNQDILTEEFVKSATKKEVVPDVAVEEEVTTEEAPLAEDVTQEQLDEVRALEEDSPVAEEEVAEAAETVTPEVSEQIEQTQEESKPVAETVVEEVETGKREVEEYFKAFEESREKSTIELSLSVEYDDSPKLSKERRELKKKLREAQRDKKEADKVLEEKESVIRNKFPNLKETYQKKEEAMKRWGKAFDNPFVSSTKKESEALDAADKEYFKAFNETINNILNQEAPVAEEEVTTEEAPITEQASAFQKETATEGKVPEVTQEQQDRYNNKEMSEQEIKDVLVGLNTKVQMRAEGKTEEKITPFEKKIKKENENLYREVVGMRPAPKTETKVEAPKKKAPKKETPVKEEVTTEEAPKKKPVSESDYDFYSPAFSEKEGKNTVLPIVRDKPKASSMYMFKRTGENTAEFEIMPSKIEAAFVDTYNNLRAYTQTVEDSEVNLYDEKTLATRIDFDIEIVKPGKVRKNADGKYEVIEKAQIKITKQKAGTSFKNRATSDATQMITPVPTKTETKKETPTKKEAPKKEAPKKETGLDAKLRAIAVKMDKAAKEKVSSKVTKAEKELIKKNPKRFKEINDEVKMPTTTADGIRSAIKMVEDSFKEKETKLKEQIKTIDGRVTDRMTKDKERQKKKDELSKARKEKNAKVKELKGKLKDMGAKFRLSDDIITESPEGFITEDEIVEGMKKLGPVEKGFKIPSGIKEGDVDPIAQSKSTKKITDAQAKKLGFKSVADMLKNIQEFNDIPMIVAMSDVLASGVAKDSMGNDMQVDGGLLYNVLGSNIELAWAGVNETGANTQYNEALDLYRANKELFDRLWKEGKLPQNHVPMVVLRMGNSAINSNEAMFRYLAPLIKSFPKQNQDEAFSVLMESIEGKKNVSQKSKSGRDTVKSAEQLEEIINKNNITDVGSLFDFIVRDAKKRAKGDNENTIPLPTRALLFDLVVSPTGVKKPSKGVAKALLKDTQSEGKEFLADKILSDIGETSMMESEAGDAVAIMGVDVINGGVRKANHNNYGFGPKGRLIALIKNPMNGLNIFPEWRAKAVRVFKKDAKGEMPTLEKVLRQVGGAFFIDKAFRGARVQTEQSDIDVISGKMRFAFPGVSVSQTQQEFDEALKQEGIRTAESNGNTILGLTKDGKIFLNPSRKSLSTPIHEFGHIWIDFLRSESSKTKGTKLLKRGLELVEGTKALESAIKKYGDNELAREEALVELMGTKGETIANAAKRAKFIEWFNAFFKYIKEKLTRFKDVKVKDIKDISLEDFVDIGLAELFSGEAVDKESKVKFKPEEAATSAKARMQMEDKGVDLKGAIEKVIARARAKDISDNVIIAYLMEDKGFDRKKALATIKRVNRKNLRSAIKSLFASVKDITNISEQEAELVKELLKYDRATTRADKAIQKKAKEELLAQVRVMARVSKGKISAAQLSAVLSRLTRVNLSRQSSIDGFVDYMRKVFSDADYAQKLTGLKSKIKQAKKNIRTKVGIGQDGLTYELENLLNIDPSIIPDDVFTKYEKLVTSFGAKKTVLSLPEATQVKQDIAEINDSLNTQNSLVGELTERFNSFEDKKTNKDGKVEYAATVKRMLKDKVITEEEAKLMTKFSKEINPREEKEGKSEEQKEKEMEEEKKELVQEVKDSEIDTSGITNRLAKQVAESLSEMIKTEAINELSNPQLKNLIKAIDNINNGYVNHYSQLAWENLMSTNFAKTATEAVKKAKPLPLSRAFAKMKSKFTGKTDIYTMIERTPLFYMDTVLGDFASKDIFNSILKDPAAALAAYQSASKQLYEKLDAVENSLMRAYKRNGNKIIESKYKQMAYMIQLEHESNPDSKETKPASQIMEATIQSLYDSNQKRNAEVLEKILKEYSDKDGNIDLKKLKDSFKPVENKMIKVVQEVNSELTEKAVFTAGIIRGEAIDPLNNYVHHQVLSSDGSTMDNVDKLSESVVNNTKPSTKAKNLIERVSKVSPINFDILSATKRGAKMTLIDYHLTSPLRVANKTLNKVQDSLPSKGEQREIFNGIRDGYNQAIKDVLSDNFSSNTFGADIDNFILKAGYRTMLVGGRFVSELLSNMLFAMKNPTIVKAGMAQRKVAFSAIGPKVVQNLKSPNQNRLYPEGLSGKLVDQELLSQAKGTGKAVQGKSKFVNVAAQVGSYATDNMTTRGLVALADKMISTPDMLATRTVWFGNFATEFKKLTGQEVDFNKIAENDAEYMSKFKKELAQATKTADREAVLIGATDNPLMGILKNKKRVEDSGFIKMFKNFNGFMQKFLVFEFNAFRIGVQSAIGRGEISSIEGGKLLAAALIRMTSYVVVTPLVSDLVVSTIGALIGVGDDDDEEEKKKRGSLEQQVARGVASSAVTLLSGSGGAGVKSILNFGTEYINKNYGAELGFRDKDIEYDPFLNSIAFNIVPEQKEYGSPNLAEDFVPRVAGAYAPFYNTANLSYKLLTAPELKEDDAKERRRRELEERLPLEVLGQLGLVPFYKEARKAVLKDIYKGVGKKKKSSGKSSRPKRPSRGKRKSRPKR